MRNKIDLDKARRRIGPVAERPHRHCPAHRQAEAGASPATAARHQTHLRSIVAGLMAGNKARIVSSIAS